MPSHSLLLPPLCRVRKPGLATELLRPRSRVRAPGSGGRQKPKGERSDVSKIDADGRILLAISVGCGGDGRHSGS